MKKGDYFLDKYVLDGETSFLETTFVYRIDSIDEKSGEALCTKVSLSFETEKKTSKKNVVKAGVSETKISNTDNFKQINEEIWNTIVFQVYETIGTVTRVRLTLSQFCKDCIYKGKDECNFCIKENNKNPTNFKEK